MYNYVEDGQYTFYPPHIDFMSSEIGNEQYPYLVLNTGQAEDFSQILLGHHWFRV